MEIPIGPYSGVLVNDWFDRQAEVQVVGVVTSAVRLPVEFVKFVVGIIKLPFTRGESITSIKASLSGFGKGLIEIIPIVGAFAARYFNIEARKAVIKEDYSNAQKFVLELEIDALRDSKKYEDRLKYKILIDLLMKLPSEEVPGEEMVEIANLFPDLGGEDLP